MSAPRHLLAIDLVEPFQLAGARVPHRHWGRFPSRLACATERALDLLDRHGARATFFADEWTASRHADLVAEIARRGHEVGALVRHGEAIAPTLDRLAEATGRAILGARLLGPRDAAEIDAAALGYAVVDAPVSGAATPPLLRTRRRGSGTYIRLLPDRLMAPHLRTWTRSGAPQLFRFAVSELDPAPTPLAVLSRRKRVRSYTNLGKFPQRLARLLATVPFGSVADSLGLVAGAAPPAASRAAFAGLPELDATRSGVPVSIVVPCYNEAAGLGYLANGLAALEQGFGRRHPLSFVLVDDGSSDATWAEMRRLFGDDDRVRLVRHERNRGVAAAILTGIRAARDEVVAVIDSDCSYEPARIEEMLPLLEPDVALVTASPYHPMGGVEGVPAWRLVLSRSASLLYRLVLRNKLATYTSCFRVGRRSVLAPLVLRHDDYIGVVEMLARLDLAGWRIREHPVVLEARLIGQSKIRIVKVIAGHLRFLGELVLARRSEQPRTLPASLTE